MNQRLHWIDTAKGILIIIVVFHHIVNVGRGVFPTEHMEWIKKADVLYAPFFMQAFFFITGYCSSFNKPFHRFLISNLKTLALPLIVFAIINQSVEYFVLGNNFFFVHSHGKEYFFICNLYWFLSALIFSKILLYGILKLTQTYWIQFSLVLFFFLLSIALIDTPFSYYNYFHWHNALCMTIFLWFGYLFKEAKILESIRGKIKVLISLIYIVIIIALVINGKMVPYYSESPHFNLKYVPIWFILATTGILMILFVSQKVNNNNMLEFFGKNSIVIYGMHFGFLTIVEKLLYQFFPMNNRIDGLMFFVLIFVVGLFLCYFASILFMYKPFKFLIGKF